MVSHAVEGVSDGIATLERQPPQPEQHDQRHGHQNQVQCPIIGSTLIVPHGVLARNYGRSRRLSERERERKAEHNYTKGYGSCA